MAAKLGLAFGSEALGEGWRSSSHAEQLRDWLWAEWPSASDGTKLVKLMSRCDDYPLANPPNHVVHFTEISDALAVTALVFGTLPLVVPVAPLGTPRPETAWRSGPAHRPVEVTTFEDLLVEAARRRYGPAKAIEQ